MTTRIEASVATGFLVVGILVGAAGAIVVRDAARSDSADHMRGMTASAGSMGDMAGMMSMMGGSWPMDPDASMMPGDHESHHASPGPGATR